MSNLRPSWSPETRGRVRRVYLFVVTSLAVCVFGLLFVPRAREPKIEVDVDIEQRLSGRTHLEVTDVFDRWVANDANLRRAVRAVTFEGHAAAQSVPMVYASWSFHAEPASGDAADSLTLTISCPSGQDGWESASDAATLINHLAQLYVDDQSARHTAKAEKSYRSADTLQQIEQTFLDEAQNELKRFDQKVTRDRQRRLATRRVEPARSPQPKIEAKVHSVEQTQQAVKNHSWIEVQRQLTQLRQQRLALLVNLTEAHPRVLELDDEIARVVERLMVTPLYSLVDAPPGPAPSDKAEEPPAAKRPAPSITPLTEDSQELRRITQIRTKLQQNIDTARQRLEAAQQELLAAHDGLLRAREVSPARITTLATAAEPVESNSGRSALAFLGCVALVLGGGVCVKGVRVDPTLRSSDEVERTLSLPVIGALAVDDRADGKLPVASPPGWTRRLSRGGEFFLFVFALVLTGLAVADSGFAARCWSDPVRAPSYAARRAVTVLCGIPAEPAAADETG
ncbi:MAG: hypothetical protein IIA67_04365 [Planctomycetes bacterium]|nr:hypothetical protein [Planctomycetota bacterium]